MAVLPLDHALRRDPVVVTGRVGNGWFVVLERDPARVRIGTDAATFVVVDRTELVDLIDALFDLIDYEHSLDEVGTSCSCGWKGEAGQAHMAEVIGGLGTSNERTT